MSLIAAFIYILLTSTLSGALGMAGGAILLAIFLLVFPLPIALILHGLTQFSSNGFRAYINREHLNFSIILPYALGAIISYGVFELLQLQPNKKVIFILLGLMPLLGIMKRTSSFFDIEKKGRSFLCGIFVSATQVVAGVSGSVLDLFYLSSSIGRFSIVSTKAFTQAFGHALKTVYFIKLFNFEYSDISIELYSIALITPLLGGLFGKKILTRFSDQSFLVVAKTTMIFFSGVMLYKGFV
ncbi:hypothetical protein BIY24_05080 [Halobacteriovorax marinus]|uniref:Probable membrane transporter protein n=1 Tax=Halobacteriovorax marinus (strain ATCC BAA-682 / DSM 15412 / SJ) TaxID=862908 RepID=E1WYA2_HALMS|nr:TSUP family transporter [Halobacteriovorax marinus]ATH07330.1 hypothetical protein BIY24_05080 [Halobacteriovorax marinus]CBW25950.1 putative membrane protein [Halobacteriovorax marinus SJ]